MVAVALDKLSYMIHPKVCKMCASTAYILVIPFVIKFIHHEYAVFIA